MAAQPLLLEAVRPTRVWGPEMTAEMVMAARVTPWLEAARLTREWGPEMTAEMVTAARMMPERTAAGRVVADRVEERAEKLASLLEGIG